MRYLLSFLLLLWVPILGAIPDSLERMSLHERFLLRKFVDRVIQWNQFGHVLCFDNKPMSLAAIPLRSTDRQFCDVLWLKGWKAFQKYESSFPHPNFIFNASVYSEDDWESFFLFFINKRALMDCLKQKHVVFQQILGQQFSPEWFLKELEEGTDVYTLINNNEILLGILLGYGEKAARAFQSHLGQNPREYREDPHYKPVEVTMPQRCRLLPVVIMGDPDSVEMHSRITEYEQEARIFWKDYQKADPLEFFLQAIASR